VTILIAAIGGVIFGGAIAFAWAVRRQHPPAPQTPAPVLRYMGELVRHRVVAHTKDDRSIRGVLVSDYPDCILLDAPEYLAEPETTQLKGRAVILRSNLAWIQVLSNDGS